MIVKRNLSPLKVLHYVAAPLAWAALWSVAAPVLYELTDDSRVVLPFAPIGALGGALAIFLAFRNNTAFGRWNEGRVAWQNVMVACRVLTRQVVASTQSSAAAGTATDEVAHGFARETATRLIAFGLVLMGHVRGNTDWERVAALIGAQETQRLRDASNAPNMLLTQQSVRIKDAIRDGVLGQFDPISMEPQMAALNGATGVIERIKHTPTPSQYDYFTRRFVELFAMLAPFGLLSVVPNAIWWTVPLALVLSGVYIIMAVTGQANDEPFAGRFTDVPMVSICREIERDLLEQLGDSNLPPRMEPVDGYLW
jgi:ion channel-forming bestrophin family protein